MKYIVKELEAVQQRMEALKPLDPKMYSLYTYVVARIFKFPTRLPVGGEDTYPVQELEAFRKRMVDLKPFDPRMNSIYHYVVARIAKLRKRGD